MKTSIYNYFIPHKGRHVFFNGLSKKFFLVSEENHEEMEQIVRHPEAYAEMYASFINKIKEAGFVVDDETDEVEEAYGIFKAKRDNEVYKLMILPTYACNLSCWYCVQRHRNLRLSSKDIALIKKHISFYLDRNKDIKELMLSWFGGEPMLSFDIVRDISKYAMSVCEEKGVLFSNTITTNGTLLTPDRLDEMRELRFTFFQITLDGCKEDHDKTRHLPNQSSYELILKNVNAVLERLPDATCCLRFNYTDKNVYPEEFIEGINERVPAVLRKNILLSFKRVWQTDNGLIDQCKMDALFHVAKKYHYRTDADSIFNICYVECLHYNTIFPNGRVDKCDNIDPSVTRGEIMDDGDIRWDEEPVFKEHHNLVRGETECYGCKYFPVCYGPCPNAREIMWKRDRYIKCMYTDRERDCTEKILRYCEVFL